jgi:hypothetical protein
MKSRSISRIRRLLGKGYSPSTGGAIVIQHAAIGLYRSVTFKLPSHSPRRSVNVNLDSMI